MFDTLIDFVTHNRLGECRFGLHDFYSTPEHAQHLDPDSPLRFWRCRRCPARRVWLAKQ